MLIPQIICDICISTDTKTNFLKKSGIIRGKGESMTEMVGLGEIREGGVSKRKIIRARGAFSIPLCRIVKSL